MNLVWIFETNWGQHSSYQLRPFWAAEKLLKVQTMKRQISLKRCPRSSVDDIQPLPSDAAPPRAPAAFPSYLPSAFSRGACSLTAVEIEGTVTLDNEERKGVSPLLRLHTLTARVSQGLPSYSPG